MANLSNGGINVWRPVVATYQWAHGQTGPVYSAAIDPFVDQLANGFAWVFTGAVLFAFCLRVALAHRDQRERGINDAAALLAVFTFSALAFTQFAPRSHLGHGYVALTLLVLFLSNRWIWRAWLAMAFIHFYALFATYGIGQERLPDPTAYGPAAQPFIAAIRGASNIAPSLVRVQTEVNNSLGVLPYEPWISVLSAVYAGVAVIVLIALWRHLAPDFEIDARSAR
jgi:hypothetical protein